MRKLFIATLCLFFIFASSVKFPGTVDDTDGDLGFTNLNNAKAEDGSFATVIVPGDGLTEALHYSNFGFTIPTGATIDAITGEYKCKTDDVDAVILSSITVYGNSTSSVIGESFYIPTSLSWVNPEGTFYLPDIEAQIGAITSTTINGSDFGVEFLCSDEGATVYYVDAAKITIDYTEAASGVKKRVIGYGGGKTETFDLGK